MFIELSVRRPIMAVAINLILLIIGMVSFYNLEFRHTPTVVKNEIQIVTNYPGANSLAVEHQVTKTIEDAISGVNGIKTINSESQDGQSNIHVKVKSGIDSNVALSQIRDRVLATASLLPESVKRSEFNEQSENNPSIIYLNFEDNSRSVAELSDYIRRTVEEPLRLVDGVASIGYLGDKKYLVAIDVDPAALVEHGVTVKEIIDALRREKTFASGGEVEGVTSKVSVVLTALVEKPADFANVTIKTSTSGRVKIGDVSTVYISEQPTYSRLRSNGKDVVGIDIKAKPQANPLEVAKRIYKFVDNLKKQLPSSMKIIISFDATEPFANLFVKMKYTLIEAIILVGIIVILSLGSLRAALFAMVAIPLCLISTFALMLTMNFSINPVTLLALVLAVGLVVDDAIVVVENIHRHMESGSSAVKATLQSMKEITFPVVVMTITLAAVYLPLVFQTNDSVIIFREFAWTLAGSVIISGFVALTLTPALCGKFLTNSDRFPFWDHLAVKYRGWLNRALQYPSRVFLLLCFMAGFGMWGFQRLSSELTPVEDQGYFQGTIIADNSVPDSVRTEWFEQVENILKTIPEKESIMTGVWQDQWMWWSIMLKSADQRDRTSMQIIKSLRPKLQNIIGPMVFVNENTGLGAVEPLRIIIQNPDQYRLVKITNNIMNDARQIHGFAGLDSDYSWQKPRLKVIVDRDLASELGISIDSIEDTLYTLLSGKKAADFNFQGIDYDVKVRAPLQYRSELTDLNAYFVYGQENQMVPLGSLVTLKEVLEPVQIKHYDRMRGASINVSLLPDMTIENAMKLLEPIVKQYMHDDSVFRFGGMVDQYKENKNSRLLIYVLALSFIYLVLAALFESFVYPFIVLLTVPLSMVGAVWAINLIGGTNNAYTSIGLLTLIGLISKHGILIVDFSNRLYSSGIPLKEAILSAAEARLRPVLMTTFAMICGAIPLIFGSGAGAVARQHVGWVIIGGMTTGTILSLFVLPVVYNFIHKLHK